MKSFTLFLGLLLCSLLSSGCGRGQKKYTVEMYFCPPTLAWCWKEGGEEPPPSATTKGGLSWITTEKEAFLRLEKGYLEPRGGFSILSMVGDERKVVVFHREVGLRNLKKLDEILRLYPDAILVSCNPARYPSKYWNNFIFPPLDKKIQWRKLVDEEGRDEMLVYFAYK